MLGVPATILLLSLSFYPEIPENPEPEITRIEPRVRVIDLNAGESEIVTLCNNQQVTIRLLQVHSERDPLSLAVRKSRVSVEVNGQRVELVSATYHLPTEVAGVRIDCSITRSYNENGNPEFWNLDKDARLRIWPAGGPLLTAGTFQYPIRQQWFASDTQMANVPVFVDGGERPGPRRIYYHSGLDMGGSEGDVTITAATDAWVVSVGESVLNGHQEGTPVEPRYDVVYLLDGRGWYYRYSHLQTLHPALTVGQRIQMGDPIGQVGKEGGSGGWSHLHFEIKSRQPSNRWGTQEGYAFLWEAYVEQYRPPVLAIARPHHLVWTHDTVTHDATRSWTRKGNITSYEWQWNDGTTISGPKVQLTYDQPGRYSEILKVTNQNGDTDYDFAVVIVVDRKHPDRPIPTIHPTYYPTQALKPNDSITFKVRSFNVREGNEIWDFGDGTPKRTVQSDGNAVKLDPDGYAVTTHRYTKPGSYLVRVERSNRYGVKSMGHLHIEIGN